MVYAMTYPFDEEPDFSAPIEPVKPSRARPWIAAISIVLIVVVIITGLAGFGLPLIWHPEVSVTFDTPAPGPTATTTTAREEAAAQLAVIDDTGHLSTMDANGGSVVRHDLEDVRFTFPAWSPDGSHIAVTGVGPGGSGVYVIAIGNEAAAPAGGGAASSEPGDAGNSSGGAGSSGAPNGTPNAQEQPLAIYLSQDRPAFYLYWTPNSRSVAFLTSQASGAIDLRVAPADASADATIVRQGAPMYWAWVDDARLLVHAGGGTDAFLGEVAPDGEAATGGVDAVDGTGAFRAPAVSADGLLRAYAGRGTDRAAAVIVEPRGAAAGGGANGAARTEVKVLGPAAVEFDPAGDLLAFVARATTDAPTVELPVGPLKIVDPNSGKVRTLLPGSVVGFFWSPDGRSIAALRLSTSGTPATANAATDATERQGDRRGTDAARPRSLLPGNARREPRPRPPADLRRPNRREHPLAAVDPPRRRLHQPGAPLLRPVRPEPSGLVR